MQWWKPKLMPDQYHLQFCATPEQDYRTYDFLLSGPDTCSSIGVQRYFHLFDLSKEEGFQIALRNPRTEAWTKWRGFYAGWHETVLQTAYDVHRSVLRNEVVIESDCLCKPCELVRKENKERAKRKEELLPVVKGCLDCYGANYEATRILGAILESKGMVPSYYYSGSKSIHVHVYLDWRCFKEVDTFLIEKIKKQFKYPGTFWRRFMEWFRQLLITCWGVEIREFDKQLIKSSHLIRCELSRNKTGFKTFLGHTYKDLSFIPYVCNEQNKIIPVLGERLLSRPESPQELLEEFLASMEKKGRAAKTQRKERSLLYWTDPEALTTVKGCVRFILSDEFKAAGDGYKRAMFLIANELKRCVGKDEALAQLRDWVQRMGCDIRDQEVEYRVLRDKEYIITHETVHELLVQAGFHDPLVRCRAAALKEGAAGDGQQAI